MHSVKMAFNLARTGHLSECEIKPLDNQKGSYHLQTVAPKSAGNDKYTLTDSSGEKLEIDSIDKAKEVAKSLGFKKSNIKVLRH